MLIMDTKNALQTMPYVHVLLSLRTHEMLSPLLNERVNQNWRTIPLNLLQLRIQGARIGFLVYFLHLQGSLASWQDQEEVIQH